MNLLDNRKKRSARDSMECLIQYARQQDNAIALRKTRMYRGHLLLNTLFFGTIGFYTLWNYAFGSWQSIYPRSFLSLAFESGAMKKRLLLTPEIYLKDQETFNEGLRQRDAATTQQ